MDIKLHPQRFIDVITRPCPNFNGSLATVDDIKTWLCNQTQTSNQSSMRWHRITGDLVFVGYALKFDFLHDRPWISSWIKSISDELDITSVRFHVLTSQLSFNCDIIRDRLWRHLQNVIRATEEPCRCVRIVVFLVFYGSACPVRNKIMYILSWRTVSALIRVLFWWLFPSQTGK